MSWTLQPMRMSLLRPYYAQRANGTILDEKQRVLHPLAARALMAIQDELFGYSDDSWPEDKPIMVFHSMTRDNAFQYRLVKENKKRRSSQYPNGIPTAKVGSSLHAFGLAVDININATLANAKQAGIEGLDYQELRQFLAGFGAIGIQSENWHYNMMLRPRYYEYPGWKLRNELYARHWAKDLTDEQKVMLLKGAGCVSESFNDMTTEFQSRYGQSLAVDGNCGPNTCRAAYVEWAHNNFQLLDVPE